MFNNPTFDHKGELPIHEAAESTSRDGEGEHPTSNIQHPIKETRAARLLDVGC
jgi:hypothetical protein